MLRRYVVPAVLLVAIIAFGENIPFLFENPDPADLERDSDKIGWTPAAVSDELAHDVFLRVNDERAARGLTPLAWHDGLADIAGRWSEEMIATGFRHSTPEFRAHPEFLGTGENIAMGQFDATEVHVGWMRSDGHRDNLLTPSYTAMGVGIVCRNDGRMWATQIFGVAASAPPALAGTGADAPVTTPVEPIVRDDPGPACPTPSSISVLPRPRFGG